MTPPTPTLADAIALHQSGRLAEAAVAYARLLADAPHHADAHHLLGVVRSQKGDASGAEASIRQALHLKAAPEYLSSLGNVLKQQGRLDEAVAAFRQALGANPRFAQAHYNLANTLKALDRLEESVSAYLEAIRLSPGYADAHANLGNAFQALGRFQDALVRYREAQRLHPNHANAQFSEALVLLLTGAFEAGWPKYRWRWHQAGAERPPHRQPLWDGRPLAGRTILLHCEQGFGDSLQMARYTRSVKRSGGAVLLECQPALHRLFIGLDGVDHVHVRGENPSDLDADVQAPLLDLPGLLWQDAGFAADAIPYLSVPPDRLDAWRARLAPLGPAPRIGLVWRGNPSHTNDRNRSLPPALLRRLVEAFPTPTFVNLQLGLCPDERALFDALPNFRDPTAAIADFADTAALISLLDLVITVDTAVAHLAGALGRPAWVLLPYVPDWRWLLDRTDSPWYPSLRLFRQPQRGAWPAVLDAVAAALAG